MPCYSWGIPAESCLIGKKLAAVQESVCAQCYALAGFYRVPKVQAAYQRRLERSDDPRWIEAMVKLVYWQAIECGEPFFRWFDSGDLQDVGMLDQIVEVAIRTPEIQHWLPTREYGLVRAFLRTGGTFPSNLVVRISAPLIDGVAPQIAGLPTSGVHSPDRAPTDQVICEARETKPANCGNCRACWDSEVQAVSYPLHVSRGGRAGRGG